MGFSAIISAPLHQQANEDLEAQGFGSDNFSVPLWLGDDTVPASYGMNVAGELSDFKAAVEAITDVSIREAPPGTVEFDEHVASLGLKREPSFAPEQHGVLI
jgi:hypothetical protein